MNTKSLGIATMLAIATTIMGACTEAFAHHIPSHGITIQSDYTLAEHIPVEADPSSSWTATEKNEFAAFADSSYSYCDAEILSQLWGTGMDETKMRIGRKVLWGDADVGILEQFLVDARSDALKALDDNPQEACYFGQSDYTYEDAVDLAKYWGEADPWQAKLRIERNLLLNNSKIIDQALVYAKAKG
jgi:hypothetical protein